jgi:hypothetical protein
MVTGRNRWPGQPMDSASWPNMANSSHIVIQKNHFEGNELANIAASFTRSLTVASNCDGTSDVEPALGPETQGVRVIGHCGAVTKPPPSDVRLDVKPVVNAGAEAQLSASARDATSFSWLVQPANHRFPSGQLPPAPLSATSEEPRATVVLGAPGLFDVDVTADNGELASIAHTQIAVPPNGIRIGESPTDWASGGAPATAVDGLDGRAVRVETTVATAHARGEPITAESKIAFFLRAENPKPWQRGFTVRVSGPEGTASFINQILDAQRPAAGNILKFGERDWIYVQIPLKGGDGFTRTGTLPSAIDTIAIESAATPGDPLALIVDDLTLF